MKIVINQSACGLWLSAVAAISYGTRKGMTVDVTHDEFGSPTFWTVPESERPVRPANWEHISEDERAQYQRRHAAVTLYPHSIPRTDPDLVAVVEQIGEGASDKRSRIEVVDIPDDVKWRIEEHDGREWIVEVSRYWG